MHEPRRLPLRSALAAAGAALAAVCVLGPPTAVAAPPSSDEYGYVDSWARCASPSVAVVFGYTDSSRVAVCKGPDGDYQYRGVRVRDGAKLAIEAEPSGNDNFVAENDGMTYTVTPEELVVSVAERVIRDEEWQDYHGPGSGQRTAPTGAGAAPASPATPTKPLPPPLPAEVGGGS